MCFICALEVIISRASLLNWSEFRSRPILFFSLHVCLTQNRRNSRKLIIFLLIVHDVLKKAFVVSFWVILHKLQWANVVTHDYLSCVIVFVTFTCSWNLTCVFQLQLLLYLCTFETISAAMICAKYPKSAQVHMNQF